MFYHDYYVLHNYLQSMHKIGQRSVNRIHTTIHNYMLVAHCAMDSKAAQQPSQTTSTIGFPTSARIRIVIAVCPPIVVAHIPPASSIHLSSHLFGTLTFNLSVP